MFSAAIALGLIMSGAGAQCPRPVNVADLCQFVADETAESNPSTGTEYVYRTKIREAACVRDGDSSEEVKVKIRAFWSEYNGRLVCNVLNSGVRNGHILKLAVNRSSTNFIKDVTRRWKVDLNHVDADGKTVMDYLDDEIAASRGTSREATLRNYLQLIRAGGGRYKREL